jgi:hypothetical protein
VVVGHFSCFHSLLIGKRTAINMGMQEFVLYIDYYSFEYMPKSDMERSKGKSIFSV